MAAYWIAHVTVTDPEAYKGYQALAPAAFATHGARFLARGGQADVLEGPAMDRHVVIEFPSLQAARDCYHSPAYARCIALRSGKSVMDLSIIEGYGGPQPQD